IADSGSLVGENAVFQGRRAWFGSADTVYSSRLGGFFCELMATFDLFVDGAIRTEMIEARHGDFKGELHCDEFSVLGASTDSDTGSVSVLNYIKLGDRKIFWFTGSPEGSLPGSPGDICLSSDGNLYRKDSGTGTTGWLTT